MRSFRAGSPLAPLTNILGGMKQILTVLPLLPILSACGEGSLGQDELSGKIATHYATLEPGEMVGPPGTGAPGLPTGTTSSTTPPPPPPDTNGGAPTTPEGSGGMPPIPEGEGGSTNGGSGPKLPVPCEVDPFADREGPFKMVVFSKTDGFRHGDSILSGQVLLKALAQKWGIEALFTEDPAAFIDQLEDYDLLFMLNTTGDIFTDAQQNIFVDWLATKCGAIAGTHSMIDTEKQWSAYADIVGPNYDGHTGGSKTEPGRITIQPGFETHPSVAHVANGTPWQRGDEWYHLQKPFGWETSKPNFLVIARLTSSEENNSPVIWGRQHQTYRLWYTNMGHNGSTLEDPEVQKHIEGGLLWSVRRGHWLNQ